MLHSQHLLEVVYHLPEYETVLLQPVQLQHISNIEFKEEAKSSCYLQSTCTSFWDWPALTMVSRTSFSVSNQSKNEMIFSCLNVFIILISCRRRSSSSGDLPSFGINFKATNWRKIIYSCICDSTHASDLLSRSLVFFLCTLVQRTLPL